MEHPRVVFWVILTVICGLCRAENLLVDSVPRWVQAEGYPIETHEVISQGYIMRVHRIPNADRPAVLIIHGLFCSSVDWVFHGPNKALGYLLYDAGVDVWMGNLRGTPASLRHECLNPTQKKFWNFSFHEHGLNDMTAMTDYILAVTGQRRIHFIGNSMAGPAILAALSELPRYNDKYHQLILYAPHTNMAHVTGPVAIVAPYRRLLESAANAFGITNFPMVDNDAMLEALHRACSRKDNGAKLCLPLHNFFLGNFAAVNYTLFVESTRFYPVSTSIKTLIHVLQTVGTDTFSQYDYGVNRNLQVYKSLRPPVYNLSRVTAPVVLFHSRKDHLVPPEDIEWLKRRLPNVVKTFYIDRPDFAHTSYLWHPDVRELIYRDTVKLIVQFNYH